MSKRSIALIVVLVLGQSVVLLVAGLRSVLLTDATTAIVTSDVRTSCDLEACYHEAEVEFVTASGEEISTEASVAKDAIPGDRIEIYYYQDNPTDLTSARWWMVAIGGLPVGTALGALAARTLHWFTARRHTRVTRLDGRLPP